MIKIYYCNSASSDIPTEISEYRQKKIFSAKQDETRLQMINAAKVLKAGFAELGIFEKDVVYNFTENGKPYAENYPSIHFSLTHAQNAAFCAFYDKQIGIDCENSQRSISKEIITRYYNSEEAMAFSKDHLLLWVTKEAFAKYTGKGMALGRNELTLPYFEDELMLSGVYFKRIDICGYTAVICAESHDNVEIVEVP
jgi:4'-phosphopantetheinyl transferase